MQQPLLRKLVAEYLGSLLLAALVIGSGIAAQRLSPGDTGLQLTENAAATAAARPRPWRRHVQTRAGGRSTIG